MKKILYGVSGIGNGHANRELPIISELSKRHKIVILAYDDSYATFERNFGGNDNISLVRIAVPFIVGTTKGLDFDLTAKHPANKDIDFLKIEWEAMDKVEKLIGVPDLAITDYEPVCAAYAYAHNVPLVTIDQQSKFLFADLPKDIDGFTFEDEVERLHLFFPKAESRIACSFFKTNPRIDADEVLFFPSPIKPEVKNITRKPLRRKEILVYISSAREFVQTPAEVISILNKQTDAHFKIFIKSEDLDKYISSGTNVSLFPHGSAEFISTLSSCDGIISSAGHSLLSEAMYLAIPVYAIPVSPYEQHLNAKVIGDNNFGINFSKLDLEHLNLFVNNLEVYEKNIKSDRSVLIPGSGQDLIVDYLERNYLSNRKILVFSPPFSGHLNILKEMIVDKNSGHDFHLIITGWENVDPDLTGIDKSKVTILRAGSLNETDPAKWTFPRAYALLPEVLTIINDFKPDLIIYDFFSVEGNLAGRIKNIPYWCSVPALMGPYENTSYCKDKLELETNLKAIALIDKDFGIEINKDKVEMISDGFHLPGQINLVWSFAEITPENFMTNRADLPYVFVGNPRGDNYEKSDFQNTKPLIYFSFGTIVMGNLWNQQIETRDRLKTFVAKLAEKWSKKEYQVIFVTQGKNILDKYPDNWWVYDNVNQVEILSRADIFITHGGNNSFHEAIIQQVPMLVIPFFGDQILVANTVDKLKLGVNLGGSESIDTENKKDFMNDDLIERLNIEVEKMLISSEYVDHFIGTELSCFSVSSLLQGQIPFEEGDILLGNETVIPEDRNSLPVSIDKYLNLCRTPLIDIYPKKLEKMMFVLNKYLQNETNDDHRRVKLVRFFSSIFKVHRMNLDLPDYGGLTIDYLQVGQSWIPSRSRCLLRSNINKIKLDSVVYLTSLNSLKLEAAEKACVSKNNPIKVIPVDPKFIGDEQLVGMEDIVWGAMQRLISVRKTVGNLGSIISIQSGIYNSKGRYRDVAVIIVENSRGEIEIAKSKEIILPTEFVSNIMKRGFDKFTIGSIISERSANHSFGFDPHLFLTKTKIGRQIYITKAIEEIIQ